MSLASLTRPDLIFTGLQAADRSEVLHELAGRLVRCGVGRNAGELFRELWDREQLGSTGIGNGIAIPHCKVAGLKKPLVALGLVPAGVDFGAADGQPAVLFVLVISPSESPAAHLQALALVSRWIKSGRYTGILALRDPRAIYDLLEQEGG
jgi:nitrogen PTS system EIIA component